MACKFSESAEDCATPAEFSHQVAFAVTGQRCYVSLQVTLQHTDNIPLGFEQL